MWGFSKARKKPGEFRGFEPGEKAKMMVIIKQRVSGKEVKEISIRPPPKQDVPSHSVFWRGANRVFAREREKMFNCKKMGGMWFVFLRRPSLRKKTIIEIKMIVCF